MENENLIIKDDISNEEIKNLIYTIRGKQVMLDSDVAMLYHYQTKRINDAVKINKERFPENFCFQLTTEEIKNIKMPNVVLNLKNENNWSQFATSSKSENIKHRGKKYLPYVFTEQGIAMLSGLLKNDIAVQVSINIMNAFVEMRKFLIQNGQIFERLTNIEYKLLEHDKKFNEVFNQLQVEENIKSARLNGSRKVRLPGNANFSFKGADGRGIVINLNKKGICASGGSACAAGSTKPSHVLTALGLPDELAKAAVRTTFGVDNTKEDVDYLVQSLVEILN